MYDGKYIRKSYTLLNGQIKCLCFSSKVFSFGGEKARKGKHKSTSVCPVCVFRQSRKGEHDIWMFENSFLIHQEGVIHNRRYIYYEGGEAGCYLL